MKKAASVRLSAIGYRSIGYFHVRQRAIIRAMIPQNLTTITIERRGYGRRYSELPVDLINLDGFEIDCAGAYARPTHYDLRAGDIVRWRDGERVIEANITTVERSADRVRVALTGAHPLPPEFFYY
jgi:hypothetical protein